MSVNVVMSAGMTFLLGRKLARHSSVIPEQTATIRDDVPNTTSTH